MMKKMTKEIENWVKDQRLDFEIAKIVIHPTHNDNWRVDVYSEDKSTFIRSLKISKSYFLKKTKNQIIDLSA